MLPRQIWSFCVKRFSCSSQQGAALDITVAKGILGELTTSWRVLDDDIRSDHSPIEFVIGDEPGTQRIRCKDWKSMDWDEYEKASEVLQDLISEWDSAEVDPQQMAQQLVGVLTTISDRLVPEKNVCKYSKPWVDKELSDQIKQQRKTKCMWKRRRSPRNYAKYQEMVHKTENMVLQAREKWWEAEIMRLEAAPQEQLESALCGDANPRRLQRQSCCG